jgi:hypothetical protein
VRDEGMKETSCLGSENSRPYRFLTRMFEEGEDIQQDLQEDRRAGDQEANSQVFNWVA